MKKNFFDNEINQCELSYEFLYLLKWLLDNEVDTLKKLVTSAVKHGFKNTMHPNDAASENIQNSIIDFLDLLDTLLVEVIHEQSVKKILDKNLLPALDQIDAKVYDKSVVQSSLEKATAAFDNFPEKNPQDILFKELLKRWKPNKNSVN